MAKGLPNLSWINPVLRAFAALVRWHPQARSAARSSRLLGRNVPYGSQSRGPQVLDIYGPRTQSGPLPVVLYVHGGGFTIGTKETHEHVARRLAAAGYVVFNIDYRLGAGGAFPHAIEDVCQALLWVLDHGGDYGGDVNRIAYAGESAGANLILALTLAGVRRFDHPWAQAVFARNPRPWAILPACGILEVHRSQRYLERITVRKIYRTRISMVCRGYLRNQVEDNDLASPLCLLEASNGMERALPPLFTICGGADPILEDSERLEFVRERLGLRGETRIYPRQVHAFHLFPWLKASQAAWRDQLDFLERHLPEASP